MATINFAVAVFHNWGEPTVAPEPQRVVVTAAGLGRTAAAAANRRRHRELPAAFSWPESGTGRFVPHSSERLDMSEGAVAAVLVGGDTPIAAESAQIRLNLTLTRPGRLDIVEGALRATTSHHNDLAVPLTGQQLSPLPPTAVGG